MLTIVIPAIEQYDEMKNVFISTKACTVQLEHSLVSLSKWESKWKKPFFARGEKSIEETIDYVRCMTITQNIEDHIYYNITTSLMQTITDYIESDMTATTFAPTEKKVANREIITAEIIYYWMITFNIPFECQKWHLSRLLTLINVCNLKNQKQKPMSRKELAHRNTALNAARRKALHTEG